MGKLKTCSQCRIEKSLKDDFYKNRTKKGGYHSACKSCWNRRRIDCRKKQKDTCPWEITLVEAKYRAKKANIPFNLTKEDMKEIWVETCPILGLPLKVNTGGKTAKGDSPSLDRVIPELGYIKGNVRIISYRANRIKNDGTLEELKNIVYYIEKSLKEMEELQKGGKRGVLSFLL